MPPRRSLYKSDGTEVREVRAADRKASEEFDILPAEIVKVKAEDGTLLYARMIKPAGFEAGRKYPAVVIVYGGPGVQDVRDKWSGMSWEQVLAHKGFVVWQLDNRGSMGRGHKFESVIWHNMGAHELSDQKEGVQYLIAQGFVDPQRIGLYGWSYGGYMTMYAVTHAPGLFKAAIAGAPVANWRNYDSIYTERYMGLPEENEDRLQGQRARPQCGRSGRHEAADHSQRGRRQRALPEFRATGRGAGEGGEAVLHGGLSAEDASRGGSRVPAAS